MRLHPVFCFPISVILCGSTGCCAFLRISACSCRGGHWLLCFSFYQCLLIQGRALILVFFFLSVPPLLLAGTGSCVFLSISASSSSGGHWLLCFSLYQCLLLQGRALILVFFFLSVPALMGVGTDSCVFLSISACYCGDGHWFLCFSSWQCLPCMQSVQRFLTGG